MYVRISYNPDLSKIGKVVEVDDAAGRMMISQGRATKSRNPGGKDTAEVKPERRRPGRPAKPKPEPDAVEDSAAE